MSSFSVSNDDPISGFELDLNDSPDYFTLLSVEGTERVPLRPPAPGHRRQKERNGYHPPSFSSGISADRDYK